MVQRVNISGNVDNPEGTLDALMQIAVCDKVWVLFGVELHVVILIDKRYS